MARLGIAAAGAIVGGVIGAQFGAAATGASVGFIAGSVLGEQLFPEGGIRSPRLNDLNVTTSAYGAPRPRGFGVIREGGQIFWSTGIQEEKNTSRAGKGGGQKVEEFSYTASFAVGFGNGPAVDCLRLWADRKLIYDKHAASDAKQTAGLSFRFYPGDEEQEPDSLIESFVGEGLTPAYRGETYLVFDNLPLGDFGNRIPDISAEIAYTVTTENTAVTEANTLDSGPLTSHANLAFAVDWERQYAFAFDSSPFGDADLTGIRRVNLTTMVEDRQVQSVYALNQTLNGEAVFVNSRCVCVLPSGRVLTQIFTATGTDAQPFVVLDATSLREVARFGTPGSHLDYQIGGWGVSTACAPVAVFGEEGLQDFAIVKSDNGSFGILYAAARGLVGAGALADVWNSDEFLDEEVIDSVRSVCGGVAKSGSGTAFAITGNQYTLASSDEIKLWRLEIPAAPPPEDALIAILGSRSGPLFAIANSVTGAAKQDVLSFTPGSLLPGETSLRNAGQGMVYDQVDDSVIFHAQKNSDLTHWLIKVRVSDGDIVWRTEVNSAPNDGSSWAQSRVSGGTFAFFAGTADATQIDTRTGELLVDDLTYPVNVATGAAGAYDARIEAFVGLTDDSATVWAKWYLRRVTATPAILSDIVTSLSEVVGLEAADIDVSDLTADEVPGFVVGRQVSGRGGIQPLMLAYHFDAVESDHVVKFVKRGAAVARSIDQAELYAANGGDFLPITRQQEVELPVKFNVVYQDPEKEYAFATHSAQRILSPLPAVFDQNNAGIEFPGAIYADFAKQLAETSLYTLWIERTLLSTGLAWTHADLDPTDVIELVLVNETIPRLRIGRTALSGGLSVETDLVMEETDQYESTATADPGSDPDQTVPATTATKLFILDTPLLRDSDDPAGRSFIQMYFMMGGYGTGNWTSGSLYKSVSGTSYDKIGRIVDEMTWGSTVNALGDPVNVFATDEDNELTVFLQTHDDALESVTNEEMLNGANAAMLIKANGEVEIIQFQTVVANADGSYTLSTLLRGRRGTDTMAYDHAVGETFLLLVPLDIDKFPLNLSEQGANRYYKGVGAGQFFEEAPLVVNTSQGRALMPYAPCHVAAELVGGNDIDITWDRRTRTGGQLTLFDCGGDVPLNEDTEEYEIDIFDMPGGTIVRTVTALSSPTYTYTAADQATDGFTPPLTELTLAVYQISAQVGRGFGREQTIEVS